MRTAYQISDATRTSRHLDIEFGWTDTDMIHNDRKIAKHLTVYMVTLGTMDTCQDKNRETVPQ